jgi:hypothetical protein
VKLETLRRRVARREIGGLRDTVVALIDQLQVLIDRAQLELFTWLLTTAAVTNIAREILHRAD